MTEPVCEFCGEPVSPDAGFDTSRRIEAWEHPGRNGGSDVEWRQPHRAGGIAHTGCMQLEKQGINVRQVSLLP
jgi:hypothetical protein